MGLGITVRVGRAERDSHERETILIRINRAQVGARLGTASRTRNRERPVPEAAATKWGRRGGLAFGNLVCLLCVKD